ncbi:hypothetical protein HYN59_13295 [Flavobacterium album]|uniref:Uncharacterized protein n=1 Tax=Flavobacterium album TaxID=2175091 RepID=A0A2S1R094_9FLAO|nr:tetratricopeptide repeat protein [Flavobacterium album]AWH86024.1 hypothetical protein HYN59_13295 [Flavobacterium album]
MTEGLLERAMLLLQQQRYNDAEKILGELIRANPNDDYVLYLLSEISLHNENYARAEELINSAIALHPTASHYFFLKSRLYLGKEKITEAEKYITEAISMDPYQAEYFAFWAHIKLVRKKYSEALDIANQALALDSSHIFALNVRSTALLKLDRKEESFDTIAEALNENPNNAYTHANYGWGLLEKGETKKALDHFSEALKNDPNSPHAQAGMTEALKARFLVYRWFLQYSFWMSNMGAKYQWLFILGFYFGSRALRALADSNEALQPFLYPLVMLLFIFAFSTWIITPLSNLFLLLNPYGKHLLDKKQKISSSIIGAFLLISLLSGLTYFITGQDQYIILAFFAFTMMIPLSKLFAKPSGLFLGYNAVMFLSGATAVAMVFVKGILMEDLATVYLIGLVAFQFLANFFVTRR